MHELGAISRFQGAHICADGYGCAEVEIFPPKALSRSTRHKWKSFGVGRYSTNQHTLHKERAILLAIDSEVG